MSVSLSGSIESPRAVDKGNDECFVISHSLYRFIRHQLIYAATLPSPGEEAIALGKKQFQGVSRFRLPV